MGCLWIALAIGLVYVLVNLCISIYYTHKMMGPGVALTRQINDLLAERYDRRLVLRKGDSFQDVAARLNELAEKLEAEHGSSRDQKSA